MSTSGPVLFFVEQLSVGTKSHIYYFTLLSAAVHTQHSLYVHNTALLINTRYVGLTL